MSLNEQLKTYLERIKEVKGVENAVLTQRDGNPIQSTGVWLSKDEVFNVSSATSAIYNLGLSVHQSNLKYILIEGISAKIFLAPLKNSMDDPIDRIMMKQGIKNNNEEFFIAITAQPSVNLGAIFLQTRESLRDIKRALVLSGESFKPPLRRYEEGQINSLIKSFNVKEDTGETNFMSLNSFCFSADTINRLNSILSKMQSNVLGLRHTSVTTSGGFLVSKLSMEPNFNEQDFEQESAMSYSLYSTSNRCAWLLKKMKVNSILLECEDYFQFLCGIGDGIFSLTVDKGQQKLGLLRLLLPQYLKVLEKIIKDAKVIDNPIRSFDLKSIIGEICIK